MLKVSRRMARLVPSPDCLCRHDPTPFPSPSNYDGLQSWTTSPVLNPTLNRKARGERETRAATRPSTLAFARFLSLSRLIPSSQLQQKQPPLPCHLQEPQQQQQRRGSEKQQFWITRDDKRSKNNNARLAPQFQDQRAPISKATKGRKGAKRL